MKVNVILLSAVLVLLVDSCGPITITNTSAKDTKNETWRLDVMAQNDPKDAEFARSVETFYAAVEKQDWPTTYDMRVADYKQDVLRDTYLTQMAQYGKSWRLNTYKVLNVTTFASTNGDYQAAELIMEFNENGSVSYDSARWKYRGGKWLCDEPGLGGFLTNTRIPDWVSN